MASLLEGRVTYEVPTFQRDYSWGLDQLNEFWNDIQDIWVHGHHHYIGQMLLNEPSKGCYEIIDGQQRMTTFTLFMVTADRAIAAMGRIDENQTIITSKNQDYYLTTAPNRHKGKQTKILLNQHNQLVLEVLINMSSNHPVKTTSPFNARIMAAVKYFERKFSEFESADEITKFVSTVMDKMFVTTIVTKDVNSSYKIYECLNSRGLRLNDSDLIKNHVFNAASHKHHSSVEAVTTCWAHLTSLESARVDEYVRSVLMLDAGYISNELLYQHVKKTVTNPKEARATAEMLMHSMDTYTAVFNENVKYWNKYYNTYISIRQSLMDLKVIGKNSHGTLLMAALSRYKPAEFLDIVRETEKYVLRNNIICAHALKEQEEFLSNLGHEIWCGKVTCLEALSLLRQHSPGDDEFYEAFTTAVFDYRHEKAIIRYILRKLEIHLGYLGGFDEASIEHVMALSLPQQWKVAFNRKHADDCVNRLGNLTLLDRDTNTMIGDSLFEDKRPLLESSGFMISRLISKYKKWNYRNLCAHQKDLAEKALEIW